MSQFISLLEALKQGVEAVSLPYDIESIPVYTNKPGDGDEAFAILLGGRTWGTPRHQMLGQRKKQSIVYSFVIYLRMKESADYTVRLAVPQIFENVIDILDDLGSVDRGWMASFVSSTHTIGSVVCNLVEYDAVQDTNSFDGSMVVDVTIDPID